MKRTFFVLAVLSGFITSGTRAQQAGPQRISAEDKATQKTEMISERVYLTDKQYKKVYKLYLKQARDFENSLTATGGRMQQGPEGRDGGPGGGMRGGGPGGGMQGGGLGGMRGGGMPGGSPGGRGGDGFDGKPGGEHRQMPSDSGPYEEAEKNVQKRDRKMKKILSPEQYAQWSVVEKEMQYERFRENFMKLEDR